MINANELRIGNWFIGGWGGNSYLQVTPDYLSIWFGHTNMAQFPKPKPITLTPEILIACGFENNNDNGWLYINLSAAGWDKERVELSKNLEYVGYSINNTYFGNELKYLHQLQNIYFALTGEELPINLKTQNEK